MKRTAEIADKNSFSDVSPVEGPWMRFAHFVSSVTNPLYVAVPTFLFIALAHAPDVLHGLLWWIVTTVGITVAPLLFIRRGVRLGRYSDHHVSIREQRLVPLLFGVGCVGSVFVLLIILHASSFLLATVTAALIACGLATVITLLWKISIHLVGIAGAVTVFGLVFGPVFWLLFPLVLLVGWARWLVRAHTFLQAVAGTALAVSVTLAVFWLFGSW